MEHPCRQNVIRVAGSRGQSRAPQVLVEGTGGCVEPVASGADLDDLGAVGAHVVEGVLAQRGTRTTAPVVRGDGEDGDACVSAAGVQAPGHVADDGVPGLGDGDVLVLGWVCSSATCVR